MSTKLQEVKVDIEKENGKNRLKRFQAYASHMKKAKKVKEDY